MKLLWGDSFHQNMHKDQSITFQIINDIWTRTTTIATVNEQKK